MKLKIATKIDCLFIAFFHIRTLNPTTPKHEFMIRPKYHSIQNYKAQNCTKACKQISTIKISIDGYFDCKSHCLKTWVLLQYYNSKRSTILSTYGNW